MKRTASAQWAGSGKEGKGNLSTQSTVLNNRDELLNSIEEYKKKYSNKNDVPRPEHWSGWNLIPISIEFWLDGDSRIHERLKYSKDTEGNWVKSLLSP